RPKPRRRRKAVEAAGILHIDRERRAIAAQGRNHLAVAFAFAQRRTARPRIGGKIECKAIGAAGADRERAGALRSRQRRKRETCRQKDRRHERARRGPTGSSHGKAPPPRVRRTLWKSRKPRLIRLFGERS